MAMLDQASHVWVNKLLVAVGIAALCGYAHSAGETKWGYSGANGPQNWASLSPDYKTCAAGRSQSPIDLSATKNAELPAIEFDYRVGGSAILNDGHTIEVSYAPGSRIIVEGHSYELKQFHFHAPSENLIRGRSFPMEVHLVHADEAGHLAVIGVMIEEGEANPLLTEAWAQLPEKTGQQTKLPSTVTAGDLLPRDRGYYQFTGSLTTPPCTEGVLWMVLKTPLTASKAQIGQFTQVMHHRNNRPVQALNGRTVLE